MFITKMYKSVNNNNHLYTHLLGFISKIYFKKLSVKLYSKIYIYIGMNFAVIFLLCSTIAFCIPEITCKNT